MSDTLPLRNTCAATCDLPCSLSFRPIGPSDFPLLWSYLRREPGRTCDFSFGGVAMWVDLFRYEMAVCRDTLFIKGRMENDLSLPAFSLPVGSLPLPDSVALLRRLCGGEGMPLRFSAIPEYALPAFMELGPRHVSLLEDWSDYLYDIRALATLAGKKLAKKRNHVNQYLSLYGPDTYEPLTPASLPAVLEMMDALDSLPAPTPQALAERALTRKMLALMAGGGTPLEGGLLRAGGRVVAFTVGDVKGDTLYVHIEKALRDVPGSYEMINKCFAAAMLEAHPGLRYVNREDDAGDEGLRRAKQSYHPLELLRKYNLVF